MAGGKKRNFITIHKHLEAFLRSFLLAINLQIINVSAVSLMNLIFQVLPYIFNEILN